MFPVSKSAPKGVLKVPPGLRMSSPWVSLLVCAGLILMVAFLNSEAGQLQPAAPSQTQCLLLSVVTHPLLGDKGERPPLSRFHCHSFLPAVSEGAVSWADCGGPSSLKSFLHMSFPSHTLSCTPPMKEWTSWSACITCWREGRWSWQESGNDSELKQESNMKVIWYAEGAAASFLSALLNVG